MRMARIGVLVDRKAAERRWSYGLNVFERYMEEVLSHAGMAFQKWESAQEAVEASPDVLIAALAGEDEETTAVLWEYAERGGTILSCGGLNPFAVKLGSELAGVFGSGYARFGEAYGKADSVRFLSARPWRVKDAGQGLQSELGLLHKESPEGVEIGAALQQFAIGQGRLVRWSVDIADTIVRLQQGTEPVLTDGVPARDGSGPVNENILKADDRCAMDWDHDRLHTETGYPYYAYPYADYWRELFLGRLLRTAVDKGLTLPFVGYWPEGIRQVAMISHDSDGNQDIHAEATLELLKECGIHSTWCMIESGYSPSIYDRVKAEGHELAFHYNALDSQNGKWDEAEFDRQLEWLKKAAGLPQVHSNKNHYTRFEGWSELFAWCEKNGVESDQTRGPSKKGNVGFLFGTCHPYYPISWSNEQNRLHDVVEISFTTQDMDLSPHWSDSSIVLPFLETAAQVEGIAHFLFHQVHIQGKESVRDALRKVVREALNRGFVFWTGKQVNDWHRARRKLAVLSVDPLGAVQVEGAGEAKGAVVWVPVADSYQPAPGEAVEERFGVRCRKQSVASILSV